MKSVNVVIASAMLMLTAFVSCADRGDMPYNSGDAVESSFLVGDWEVENVNVSLVARNSMYAMMRPMAENKIRNKVESETSNMIMRIDNNGMLYRIKYDGSSMTIRDSSAYRIEKDTLFLSNPNVIGFYAEHFYVKRKDTADVDAFAGYLKRGEIMRLLEEDGSIGSTSMNTIRDAIEDGQVDLNFRRVE